MASLKTLDSPDAYTVGWIAALPIERAAAIAMLDEKHAEPSGFMRHQSDANVYTWGRIGKHNIVIASLTAGLYGTTSAATTASSLIASLLSIRIGLLVGIGGAIARPDKDRDIRLGDIVVSQPDGTTGGVCQYDAVKAKAGGNRERRGMLSKPPTVLLNALASIQADHELQESKVPALLQKMLDDNPKMAKVTKQNPGYIHQKVDNDRLFEATYDHVIGPDCRDCDAAKHIQRDMRDTTDPEIHYGTIASGNTLVKDAMYRDQILADVGEDCICFEMEAAGLMDHFPCLVIRGICDYADSHKNDRWQRYASATAAAYAKELLLYYVPAADVQAELRAQEFMQSMQNLQQTSSKIQNDVKLIKHNYHTDRVMQWLSPPDPSTNANHARDLRHAGTGTWLLRDPAFQEWCSGSRRYLWLQGLAGCGKTVLSTRVLDHLTKNGLTTLYFFFDFNNEKKQTVDGMLRSLAFQLYRCKESFAVTVNNLFQGHKDGQNQPSTRALQDAVSKILGSQENIFIILDALDESSTRSGLLRWIKDIVSTPGLDSVRLLCTGRPETEFLQGFPELFSQRNCMNINKNAVNDDIASYVAERLNKGSEFTKWAQYPRLLDKIRNTIGSKSDGMFRWAACQLDSLQPCLDREGIENALEALPLNLTETYNRMLESIRPERKQKAIRLLQFLVHSKRPLFINEAVDVIAVRISNGQARFNPDDRMPDSSEITSFCPSLVTVVQSKESEQNNTTVAALQLAHFSVKEYLLKEGINGFLGSEAHSSITQTSLGYLSSIKVGKTLSITKFPLAEYVAQFWVEHAVLVEASREDTQNITALVVKFLQSNTMVRLWIRPYQLLNEISDSWNPQEDPPALYFASLKGLRRTVQQLILDGANINAQGGKYGHALQAASVEGHSDLVKLLLHQGANVNNNVGWYGTALQAASAEGYLDIVQLLLQNGADVNARGGDWGTAVQAALTEGHHDIVQFLLDNGADLSIQGGRNGTWAPTHMP